MKDIEENNEVNEVIEEPNEELNETEDEKSIQKPKKKERTEAQKQALIRAREIRQKNAEDRKAQREKPKPKPKKKQVVVEESSRDDEEVVVYKKCLYPVDVPTGEAVVKKEFSELTASALASSKPLNARLFIKDYHNIRGTTSTEVCNTPQVSWRKAGFRLDFS